MFEFVMKVIGAGIYAGILVVSWLAAFLAGLFGSAMFGAESLWWAVIFATLVSVFVVWFVYRLSEDVADGVIGTFGNESARRRVLEERRKRRGGR